MLKLICDHDSKHMAHHNNNNGHITMTTKNKFLKPFLLSTLLATAFTANFAHAGFDLEDFLEGDFDMEDMYDSDSQGAQADKIKLSQAVEIAKSKVKGAVMSIEREKHGFGRVNYEVKMAASTGDEWEVIIDAKTGHARTHKEWDTDWDDKQENKAFYNAVAQHVLTDISEGIGKAMQKMPGSTPVGADIDFHMGKVVYEVDMINAQGMTLPTYVSARPGVKQNDKPTTMNLEPSEY